MLSVVIPTLEEAAALPRLLAGLGRPGAARAARAGGWVAGSARAARSAGAPPPAGPDTPDEIVVVDGGSVDATVAIAEAAGARVVRAARGRGRQLAAGAAAARGDRLLFLHADTVVPPGALAAVRAASGRWGCFAVRFDTGDPRLRWTAAVMNARARATGSCTGDMGIWFDRAFLETLGGWSALDAFEDLVLTDAARARARPSVLTPALTASARRWARRGVTRTVAKLLAIRWAYRLGAPPERLATLYRTAPR